MLHLVRSVFCPACFPWGTGNHCEAHVMETPVERWAMKASKLTTPDQLIAAHVVQKMAKAFDDWTVHSKPDTGLHYHNSRSYSSREEEREKWVAQFAATCSERYLINRAIRNKKLGITFCYRVLNSEKRDTFYVNGVSISDADGQFIWAAYERLLKEMEKLRAAAASAKREMELNEAKWNLYEKIAGYRRNEHGALEPVKKVERDNANSGQNEPAPARVRRKTSTANRTPERTVRQPSGAQCLRPIG